MTNEEAVEAATKPQTEIEKRIAEGLIPPAPSYVNEHAAWTRWYEEHIRCATREHAYFLRERGSRYCADCISRGVPALTIPTTDGAEVCCYGMLVAGNQHTDECTPEKRDAAEHEARCAAARAQPEVVPMLAASLAPRRKPRAMP